jgi:hypothetical protein
LLWRDLAVATVYYVLVLHVPRLRLTLLAHLRSYATLRLPEH